jgi:hypothetical protein
MRITFDTEDVLVVCAAMSKSRGLKIDWGRPWAPDSTEDKIHIEALRIVAALRAKYGN